jgi:hypothetical protein
MTSSASSASTKKEILLAVLKESELDGSSLEVSMWVETHIERLREIPVEQFRSKLISVLIKFYSGWGGSWSEAMEW